MADVDGTTESIEIDVIYSQMRRFGLDDDELLDFTEKALLKMTPHIAMDIIAEMTPSQKEYVQALLIIIMASDGEIHEREMALLRFVTMVCELPPINMMDIKNTLNTFRNR